MAVRREQVDLPVAWRRAALDRVDAASAAARAWAWVWVLIAVRHCRIPLARIPIGDLGDQIVLRIGAHLIDALGERAVASPTTEDGVR